MRDVNDLKFDLSSVCKNSGARITRRIISKGGT